VTHTFARRAGLALVAAVLVTIGATARATAEQAGNRAATAADADRQARAAGQPDAVALTAAEPLIRGIAAEAADGVRALPFAYAPEAEFVTSTGRACATLMTTGGATVAVEGLAYDPITVTWPAGSWHVWCWTGLRSGTTYRLRLTTEPGVRVEGLLTDH
jgi:hypothetical protein